MNAGSETALEFARALLAGVAVFALAGRISRWLPTLRTTVRRLVRMILLAPFFAPTLILGCGWVSPFALSAAPAIREPVYFAGLVLKLLSVLFILRAVAPEPLSPEARHIHGSLRLGWLEEARFRFRGAGVGSWIGGALVFLLALFDLEVAAVCNVSTWATAIVPGRWKGFSAPRVPAAEVWVNLLLAIIAALSAQVVARRLRGKRVGMLVLGAPGLLGPAAIFMLLRASWFSAAAAPVLPAAIALLILLFPLAAAFEATLPDRAAALHLARQTGDRRLVLELEMRPRLAAFGFLVCWAFFLLSAGW